MKCKKKKKKLMFLRPLRILRDCVYACYGKMTRAFQPSDEFQIIICGFPRSGSSLLYNILTASIDDVSFAAKESSGKFCLHKKGNWLSKLPNDVFLLNDIRKLNWRRKKVLVFLLSRDIRDIITSVHQLYPDEYYIDFDQRIHGGPGIGDIYEAYTYAKSVDFGGEIKVVPISYEDIIFNLPELQREVCNFTKCDLLCSFDDYREKGRGLVYGSNGSSTGKYEAGPLVATRHEKWREDLHKNRVLAEFRRSPQLLEMLVELGYEEDNSWYDKM